MNAQRRPRHARFARRRRQAPHIEIGSPLLEWRSTEQHLAQSPCVGLELRTFGRAVAVAEQQHVDPGGGVAVFHDLDQRSGRRLGRRGVHEHVLGINRDGPHIAPGIGRAALPDRHCHRCGRHRKAHGLVERLGNGLRFFGRDPLVVDRPKPARVEKLLRRRITHIESVSAVLEHVLGAIDRARPRRRFDDGLVQAEKLLLAVARVKVIDAHRAQHGLGVRNERSGRDEDDYRNAHDEMLIHFEGAVAPSAGRQQALRDVSPRNRSFAGQISLATLCALPVSAKHVVHSGGSGNNGGYHTNPVSLEALPNETSS